LLPQLSAHVLSVMAEGGQVGSIVVSIEADGRFRFAPKGEPYGEAEDMANSVSAKAEAETASAE
jgi:hypothetical protein